MRIVAIALPVLGILGVLLGACVGSATGTAGVGTPSPVSSPTPAAAGSPTAIASATPAATAPSSEPSKEPAMPLSLSSTAFAEGGSIPREHTCDGADISPPLAWAGLPDGAAALALVVDDPDAGGFVHWVAYNIDASTIELAAGASAAAGAPPQGRNSFGQTGYGGPCPPSGTHHYVFRLLALGEALPLSGTPTADDVLAAAAGHTLAEAQLTGTYRRGG